MATLDPAKLGERLRIARTTAGLTQEQAAKSAGVARTTMVAIERGERAARAEELVALAKLYGTTTNLLLRKDAVHVDLVAQFRRPIGVRVDDAESVEAVQLLNRLATSTVELERRLGKSVRLQYPPERALARSQLEQQAEDLALELRNQIGVGLGPILDMFSLAELELGMRLFVRPLASGIAGVFAFHAELGACVLVNGNHPRARQRWTVAHEIGHLLTARNATDVCVVDGEKPPTERFADLFAGALLLPGAGMRKRYAEFYESDGKFSPRHLGLLASRYDVSLEAIARRLEQLGLLKAGTFERLKREGMTPQLVRDATAPAEPSAQPPPLRLAVLAIEAHAKGLLSESQVASTLAIDRVEARRLIDDLAAPDDDLSGDL